MELSNIALGSGYYYVGGIYHGSGTTSTSKSGTVVLKSPTYAYCDNTNQVIYTGSGTVSADDYPSHAFADIKGIYLGNRCLTTTYDPTTVININAVQNQVLKLNQKGIVGRAFNNYVTSAYNTVWGFETLFYISSSATADVNLFSYGYNYGDSNIKPYMSFYKIMVTTAGKLQIKQRSVSSDSTWYNE